MATIGIVGNVYRQWENNLKHGLDRRYGTPNGLRVHGTDIYCGKFCIATMEYNVIIINDNIETVMPRNRMEHLLQLLRRGWYGLADKHVRSTATTPEQLRIDARAKYGVDSLAPWS